MFSPLKVAQMEIENFLHIWIIFIKFPVQAKLSFEDALTAGAGRPMEFKSKGGYKYVKTDGVSSFDPTSTRQSLDFNVPPDLGEWLQELDDWAFKTLLKESPRFFKRQVSEQELTLMFQSCIKKHSKGDTQYPDSVRTKTSKSKLRLWSFDHQPRDAPVDFRHCDLVPLIQVRNFWFSGSQCGVCLELCDLMCREQTSDCPFLD